MARIKIEDLPSNVKISAEEMRRVCGGVFAVSPSVQFGGSLGRVLSLVKPVPARGLDSMLKYGKVTK